MASIVCVRIDWNRTAIRLPIQRYHMLHYGPETGYPFGRRGCALAGAWRQLGESNDGMLLLDGDVAIDPVDHGVMLKAVAGAPEYVHTAPVRLWPVSTHLDGWVWGHGDAGRYSAKDPSRPDCFSFCYTYLPRSLIEACLDLGLDEWMYPGVDRRVSQTARENGIPIRLVRECQPKHLNFLPEWST